MCSYLLTHTLKCNVHEKSQGFCLFTLIFPVPRPRVLTFECASQSQITGPQLQNFSFRRPGVGLGICISNKFQVILRLLVHGPNFENHQSAQCLVHGGCCLYIYYVNTQVCTEESATFFGMAVLFSVYHLYLLDYKPPILCDRRAPSSVS